MTTKTSADTDSIPFIWIDSDSRLEQCIQRWINEPYLIVDTEFERSNTYHAKAGLIQVAAAGKTYLIDPLAMTSLEPLAQVLSNPDVTIVLHSMSEDIDLLSHLCNCSISSVFDTQIAAAFLGMGISVGYQRLVEIVLGVELDKGETRSDWLARPLSKKQLHYAAADVHYLEDIYKQLRSQLQESPWLEAVDEECARQVASIQSVGEQPELVYLKMRGAWDLSLERQYVLQQLTIWRDSEAIEHNIPKSWVFSDAQLIEAARTSPTTQGELFKLPKIKPKSVKRFGSDLLRLLDESDKCVPSDFREIERPIKGKELEFYKKIKKLVESSSKKAGLDSQLIAGRKQMEAWVIHFWRERHTTMPQLLDGWRGPLLEGGLTDLVKTAIPE
jgi:ribonuclease D